MSLKRFVCVDRASFGWLSLMLVMGVAAVSAFAQDATVAGSVSGGENFTSNGNLLLGANTLTIGGASKFNFGGVVSGSVGLVKDGTGVLTLAGNNTYAGGTTLTTGKLELAHDNALGTGGLTIAGGTLIGIDANRTITKAITVNGDFTIDGDAHPDRGDPNIGFLLSGTVDLGAATRTIAVNNNTLAEVDLGGVVTNGGLTKAGTGLLILSGTHTYTGTTTVNADTLKIVGGSSITDASAVVLANVLGVELRLMGAVETIGSFVGGRTIIFNGIFSPGNSPGQVTIESDAVLETGVTRTMELAGTTPGVDYDRLDVTGALIINGTLDVQLLDGFVPRLGDTFALLDFASITGDFDGINLPMLGNGLSFDTSSLFTAGSIAVNPEPSTIALVTFAVMLIASTRLLSRRRQTQVA